MRSRPIAEFLDVGAGASVHEGGMAVMVTDGALALQGQDERMESRRRRARSSMCLAADDTALFNRLRCREHEQPRPSPEPSLGGQDHG